MNNAQIAQNIKDECQAKKVPVSKLLENCGIRKGFIYDLEKRDYTPSVEIMGKIADYLNVSVDYLLGREGNKNAPSTDINFDASDNTPQQVAKIFQQLDFTDKVKVMSLLAELTEKNKTA